MAGGELLCGGEKADRCIIGKTGGVAMMGKLTQKGGRRRPVSRWRKVERKNTNGRERHLPYKVRRLKSDRHNSFLRRDKCLWSLSGV